MQNLSPSLREETAEGLEARGREKGGREGRYAPRRGECASGREREARMRPYQFKIGRVLACGVCDGVTSHRVGSHKHRHVRVLRRPIAVPSATVGRELSEQPVFRHLAEMVVVNQRVLFDLEGEYYNQGGRGRLDDNHSLLSAFTTDSRRAAPMSSGRGRGMTGTRAPVRGRMRIFINPAGPPKERSIPTAPAPPKEDKRQMAVTN